MILASIHISSLLSLIQNSTDQSDIPFWLIPVVFFIALAIIFLLHIFEENEAADASHDDHGHGTDDAQTEAVTVDDTPSVEAEEAVEIEEAVSKDIPAEPAADVSRAVGVEVADESIEEEVVEEAAELIPDDLRKVEGIGPKISGILNDAGIFTFAQLAAKTVAELEKIVREDAGIRIAFPDTWPEQAALAAAGEWDTLDVLQDELKGGRRAK